MSDGARILHDTIVASLALPASCRVDQRVPKKMLVEHGGATAADRRLLTEGIAEAHWLAALKPATLAVPAWRDEVRDYLELAVLTVELRASHAQAAQRRRLGELIHRAVPYPVLLLVLTADLVELSLAHKRAAQNETGRIVLDGEVVGLVLGEEQPVPQGLLAALATDRQPSQHLMALYQGWIDTVIAAHAARVTGHFVVAATPDRAASRRAALREHQRLEQEAARLRALAAKEHQMAKRVEHNLALQKVQARLLAVKEEL
ncbi:DUF4391 domain-containing protein [Massilia rhizosphaerae]|uniref:DUF4391 domain-containing protein n=1 Tax=Massilia rhizosphaerae TaxID=2784389 RepID=UPI001E4522D9|nr:DUF4391 domain-containing protein [Massilia rhizosphaerae]